MNGSGDGWGVRRDKLAAKKKKEIIDKTSGLCGTPSFGKTKEKSRLLSKIWSQTGFPQHPQEPRIRIREASSHTYT